jgi:hypothetical protein
MGPELPFPAVTWRDVGNAEESGIERLLSDSDAPFTGVHGEIVAGKSGALAWNALFWMSSA